ncbi:fused MFS/spermidine synthase [Paenibacillus algorifonticola]|uniref:spermidine synthase n=1 Tax=Paenibacillus algorifonticola TaxID=684063 RepID=UPI003D29BFCC
MGHSGNKIGRIWFEQHTAHHEISVYDTTELDGEKGRFRVLQFSGDATQGALDLEHPGRILFEYPRAIIHLMESNQAAFEKVFLIGHGIGTIARYFEDKTFKVAELDETVVELSRLYFGYNQDNVVIGDGRALLEGEAEHAYDYVIVDAFTRQGTPKQLVSLAFFSLIRSKLGEGGAVLLNLMGRGERDRLIHAIQTTLGEVFAYTKAFILPTDGSADLQNIILMGSDRPVAFQARHMAGFVELEPVQGYIIRD